MSKVIVSGSLAYDRIMNFAGFFAEHFMPDKLHSINLSFQVETLSTQYGGTAGNIAYSLALLHEQPEIIASAGSDFESYRTHLLSSGVNPKTIRILDERETASAFILTDKADNQIAAFHYGAGAVGYDTLIETEDRAFAIVGAGCLPDMQTLPAFYKSKSLKYLYDPAQQIPVLSPESLRDAINGAHVLFGSDYEYELMKQKTGWSDAEMRARVPTVVVTYGSKGSAIQTAKGVEEVPACPVEEVKDPTGAGDAYRAGFIKGMVLGLPYVTCARIGSTVAAYAVEQYGNQKHRFSLEELTARYKKAFGETLSL